MRREAISRWWLAGAGERRGWGGRRFSEDGSPGPWRVGGGEKSDFPKVAHWGLGGKGEGRKAIPRWWLAGAGEVK